MTKVVFFSEKKNKDCNLIIGVCVLYNIHFRFLDNSFCYYIVIAFYIKLK